MVRNLLKADFPVTVWNRSRPGIEECLSAGASEAGSPREVAEASDIVITMVTDSPDVEQVALGPGGILEAARTGLVHIDMSTISPEVTREVARKLASKGAAMLDAPVSGGDKGAIEGTLSIMVGGEADVFQRCLPVFQAMGKRITHQGPHGSGQACKLCNQIVVALNLLAVSECMVFAQKQGLNLGKMLEAVGGGAASSWGLVNLGPRMAQRDFAPGFMVKLQQKDLRLALEAAAQGTLPLPGTALTHQLFRVVEALGGGDLGTQALVTALEQMGQLEVKG
jgi:3-hydroxyisobutyrate dehydrogenase